MKCSRGFPCAECQKAGEECVPNTRKYRQSKKTDVAAAQNPQSEMQQVDPQADVSPHRDTAVPDLIANPQLAINLPPVHGGFMHWSNKRMRYNAMPLNLDAAREKLYLLEKPILLNSQQYSDYWPHVTNFCRRSRCVPFCCPSILFAVY